MPNRNKRKERKIKSISGYTENEITIKILSRVEDTQNLTMDITTITTDTTLPTNICPRRTMIGGT